MKPMNIAVLLSTVIFFSACGHTPIGDVVPASPEPEYDIVYDASHQFLYNEIFVSDASGSAPINLTENFGNHQNESPVWSPDGGRIVFVMSEGPQFTGNREDRQDEIYVMNADGSHPINVTSHPANDEKPSWSPDGRQIVFVSYRDNDTEQIFVVNADGTNTLQLTHGEFRNCDPAWSPKGSLIAFDMDWEVAVINSDGTGLRQITHLDDGNYKFPVWSPDGSRIAFTAATQEADGTLWNHIFVINPDGSDLNQLTYGRTLDENLAWSPDGSRIVFESRTSYDDLPNIFLMNANGSNVTQLTYGAESSPVWSPDGSQIVYMSYSEDGSLYLYIMNVDGSNQRRLTQITEHERNPDWRH